MTPQARPLPRVKAIACPNCGGAVELRGLGTSLHAACVQCLSVLDVSQPQVQIVQKFEEAQRRMPNLPLGTRGKLNGKPYEVLGFQVRAIQADGVEYTWDEYVLFNPYHGFLYLSEYAGHWTLIEPMPYLPQPGFGATLGVRTGGKDYRLFQTSWPRTVYVMGEFPWRVKVGDQVTARDYTAPPESLSEEISGSEVNWSRGRYIEGRDLWQAFQQPGAPPPAFGVYFNQPNPHGSTRSLWAVTALFTLILFTAMLFTWLMSRNERVFSGSYSFTPGIGEASFVTQPFVLQGGPDNVEMEIKTDLENDWAAFDFALINEETGTAYNFDKETEYYRGRDSDGSWSEGDRAASVRVGGIPGGRYYLRVEPEMEKPSGISVFTSGTKRVNYQLTLIRGKAVLWPYFLMMPFLWIPPVWALLRRSGFESQRWSEADPGGAAASASGPDDEEEED